MPSSVAPAIGCSFGSNRPYSLSFQPRSSALSRSAMLWAFEPVKYCMAAPRSSGLTQRRSAWKPSRNRMLALVSPWPSTRSTPGKATKASVRDAIGPGRQDVEVAAGVGAAPHAADRGDLRARGVALEIGDQRLGHLGGSIELVAAGVALPLLEGTEDQLFFLRPHAFQRANAA